MTADITVYAQWTATPKQSVASIKITNVSNGNGQANVDFAIRSANGKGYKVYISATNAEDSFIDYANVNYNSKGAHIKGLTNGKVYYVYIEYSDGKTTERSPAVQLAPNK